MEIRVSSRAVGDAEVQNAAVIRQFLQAIESATIEGLAAGAAGRDGRGGP
jgi:hypothetical protein